MTSTYADRIATYDSTDMYSVLCDYPGQIRTGLDIGNTVNLSTIDTNAIRNLLICGMGGSAIGGDIFRVFAASKSPVPILVNRDYGLPAWVDHGTLVVVLSYSGGTEESLSAYDEAGVRGAARIVVTSGGELLERAERDGVPVAIVPGGLAPRCALGYLFFSLLVIAARCDVFDLGQSALRALLMDVEAATKDLADYTNEENPAVRIAERLRGTIPVLYGGRAFMDAILTRWRCQIEENAKVLAYSNVLPEMNHNEIVGWEQLPDVLKRISVVALHDLADPAPLRKRLAITLDIVRPLAANVIEVHATEENELSRVFGLILLGDWVSFYLAVGSGVDPFPIRNINHLKNALKSQ